MVFINLALKSPPAKISLPNEKIAELLTTCFVRAYFTGGVTDDDLGLTTVVRNMDMASLNWFCQIQRIFLYDLPVGNLAVRWLASDLACSAVISPVITSVALFALIKVCQKIKQLITINFGNTIFIACGCVCIRMIFIYGLMISNRSYMIRVLLFFVLNW